MADDEEREGLLPSDENRARRRKNKWLPGSTAAVNVDDRQQTYANDSDDRLAPGSASNALQTLSENDFVIAVFVVAFDTKTGDYFLFSLKLLSTVNAASHHDHLFLF
jgi:hypothetical protein